jgi:hypothetical protein
MASIEPLLPQTLWESGFSCLGGGTMVNKRLPAACLAFLFFFLLLPFLPGPVLANLSDGISVAWNNGLRIQDLSDDLLYYLRLRLGFQFRYTYLHFDDQVLSNDEDWNNFMFRRLRLFFDGNFPNRDWKYFLQLQLETANGINALDAWLQWQRFPWARIQLGRMKIPYGLEFWQSGFALNGVERTIFSAETDVDGKAKDVFGNSIGQFWPGSNATFPNGGQILEGTLFPVGGMTLYRSQGVDINGEIEVPGFRHGSRLDYWLGLYNGRDTRGFTNPTEQLLYSFRLAYEPCGPSNLTVQGDWAFSEEPITAFLVSFYSYTDTAWMRYDFLEDGLVATTEYDIWDLGYDLAAILRYRGFSLDLEFAWERFHAQGNTWETEGTYDRLGGRVNTGYFFLPRWTGEHRLFLPDPPARGDLQIRLPGADPEQQRARLPVHRPGPRRHGPGDSRGAEPPAVYVRPELLLSRKQSEVLPGLQPARTGTGARGSGPAHVQPGGSSHSPDVPTDLLIRRTECLRLRRWARPGSLRRPAVLSHDPVLRPP